MRVLIILLAAVLSAKVPLFGQDAQPVPPQQPPAPAPIVPGAIEGQVVDAITGQPVRKAIVTAQNIAGEFMAAGIVTPQTSAVSTDPAGNFGIQDLQPGRYRLTVQRNGFITMTYGANGSSHPGAPIAVSQGDAVKDLVVRLAPQAVVTGRVVDEDGDPVPEIRIDLLRYHYARGRKVLQSDGGAETNDLGEYRVAGLAPGNVYLLAHSAHPAAQSANAAAARKEDFVPLYYPGVMDFSSATAVGLASAAELRLDFTLRKVRTVRVRGHVANTVNPGSAITVRLTLRNLTAKPTDPTSTVDAMGNFEIAGVVAGSYWLTATAQQADRNHAGLPLLIADTDASDLNLRIDPGIQITGHVTLDGQPAGQLLPPELKGSLFQLEPRDSEATPFPSTYQSHVMEDGTFQMADVGPDTYDLQLGAVPGYYIKSIRVGQADTAAAGIVVRAEPVGVEVMLSSTMALIRGVVQDTGGQPVPGAIVVLIPQDKARRIIPSLSRNVVADQNGTFVFGNVVPGDYEVYAWRSVEASAWMDPDFMAPLEGKGTALTVQENDQLALQLVAIP